METPIQAHDGLQGEKAKARIFRRLPRRAFEEGFGRKARETSPSFRRQDIASLRRPLQERLLLFQPPESFGGPSPARPAKASDQQGRFLSKSSSRLESSILFSPFTC